MDSHSVGCYSLKQLAELHNLLVYALKYVFSLLCRITSGSVDYT
jgi:hypothetical protein